MNLWKLVRLAGRIPRRPYANPYYDPARPHHLPGGFRNNHPLRPPTGEELMRLRREAKAWDSRPGSGMDLSPAEADLDCLRGNRGENSITWIGHATVLLQTGGLNVITDPVFSDRASPVSFAGPKRHQRPGVLLADLPRIDLVLISHGHYDHLDLRSVRRLARREPVTRIVFYFGVVSTLVSAPPALLGWTSPAPSLWPTLLALGLFATLAQLFMTRAYAHAPAAQVGPFIYSSVVFAAVFDWALFAKLPPGTGPRVCLYSISGGSGTLMAEIAEFLGTGLGQARLRRFPDTEVSFQIDENIRGTDVFVIQPTCAPVDQNLMELMIMVDAFRRSSAARITAVLPYYGYARQDRKDKPRVPISAKLVANVLSAAGTNRVLTMDLHKAQIQGFFDIPVDHLFAAPVLIDYLSRQDYPRLTIVAPDAGGAERARAYAKRLGAELAVIDKRRTDDGATEVMNVIGEVGGRTCVIADDIIDTAGTIQKAAPSAETAGNTKRTATADSTNPARPRFKNENTFCR